MSADLLTDDLAALLAQFPNDALHGLVGILKSHSSWSPFPAPRAYEAHALRKTEDARPHAAAIAREILWWGSNDLHRQFGEERDWRTVVTNAATQIGVPSDARKPHFPAWRIEQALFCKALADWEKLTPEQRATALKKSGFSLDAARGGISAALGVAVRGGGGELVAFLGARGVNWAAAATALAPVATALGTLWAAYDLAGPGYRVLRPVTLAIAFTRRRLRDQQIAAAFED
jgi:hypothetical protein